MSQRSDRLRIEKPVKDSFKFTGLRSTSGKTCSSRPIAARLPVYYRGAIPPRPDQSDPLNALCAVAHRVGSDTPVPDKKLMKKFKRYVGLWLKRNMKPLTEDEVLNFEEWLERTPYSAARKDELRRVWKECGGKPTKKALETIKSFLKDEGYGIYKMPRGIYSRSDAAKCLFGPLVQSVSEKVFNLKWFIKKVPVADRPDVLSASLYEPGGKYAFTDYTAYESHFTAQLMDICESQLFTYMAKNTGVSVVAEQMHKVKSGKNKIRFREVAISLEACRMSGEMDTSLSNGFTNLMLYLFACFLNGIPECNVVGFVEGDDGLFRVRGRAPTEDDFKRLGMTIKVGITEKLETASFCGQIYDFRDKVVVTDIQEAVCKFGWTSKKYVNASTKLKYELLRAKGYSLVYQYGKCPVLGALGKRVLELTDGTVVRQSVIDSMDQWEKQKYLDATRDEDWRKQVSEPGEATRALVEQMYNISTFQQKKMEKAIATMDIGPIPIKFDDLPRDWTHYHDAYSVTKADEQIPWVREDRKKTLQQLTAVGVNLGAGHLSQLGEAA